MDNCHYFSPEFAQNIWLRSKVETYVRDDETISIILRLAKAETQ